MRLRSRRLRKQSGWDSAFPHPVRNSPPRLRGSPRCSPKAPRCQTWWSEAPGVSRPPVPGARAPCPAGCDRPGRVHRLRTQRSGGARAPGLPAKESRRTGLTPASGARRQSPHAARNGANLYISAAFYISRLQSACKEPRCNGGPVRAMYNRRFSRRPCRRHDLSHA